MKRELDIQAFYAAVESKKSETGLSWRKLAEELDLGDHTVFTRMSRGQVPEINTLLSVSGWLGLPLDRFAHGEVTAPDSRRETMEAITSYLRADKALAPSRRRRHRLGPARRLRPAGPAASRDRVRGGGCDAGRHRQRRDLLTRRAIG